MVVLKILNLEFRYNSVKALENIELTVNEGELVSIIGPNGAGKTTLLKCIARILKPSQGTILLENKPLNKFSPKELARRISYLPQIEEPKYPLTVLEMVLIGRTPYTSFKPTKEDLEKVYTILKQLGIEHLAHRKVNELSGGEYRKIMLARALAQQPKILLLDEPVNHLDLKHQLEVLSLLRKLVLEKHITIIMAIHDLNLALRFSDKVIALRKGKIVFCGKPLELSIKIIEEVYGIKAKMILLDDGTPIIIPYT